MANQRITTSPTIPDAATIADSCRAANTIRISASHVVTHGGDLDVTFVISRAQAAATIIFASNSDLVDFTDTVSIPHTASPSPNWDTPSNAHPIRATRVSTNQIAHLDPDATTDIESSCLNAVIASCLSAHTLLYLSYANAGGARSHNVVPATI